MDVLFFGLMNPRRAALLAAVNASGLAVHVLTGETMTFGGALDAILARTKIVLNLHFYDGIMVRLRLRPQCLTAMMLPWCWTDARCDCVGCTAWLCTNLHQALLKAPSWQCTRMSCPDDSASSKKP